MGFDKRFKTLKEKFLEMIVPIQKREHFAENMIVGMDLYAKLD